MKKRSTSPNIESDLIHAGPIKGGYAGIDGDFMVNNKIGLALLITVDSEGVIMLHPGFNPETGPKLVPLIDELARQAKEVLNGTARADGTVH